MSRSKRDIIDTNRMITQLTSVLQKALPRHLKKSSTAFNNCWDDAEALRRISMTLHRWHELECGTTAGHIERDEKSGKPWLVTPRYHGGGFDKNIRCGIPDRERGAMKRLAKIMARYPKLTAYVQGDPRGCALYILKPGDVPAGEDVGAYYSRGLAVHR